MSDLIDDLFDLAKLDAPLTTIAFASVALDQVAEEAVHAHEPHARQRDITIRAVTEPVQVVGDRARLRRMCDNVLDNAVKFSTRAGKVDVNVRRDEDTAVLVVADWGIGIPADELARVFERLYRATNATAGRYPGTGLGLSIALATAEGHGGTATADHGPDGGTVLHGPTTSPTAAARHWLNRGTPPRGRRGGWHARHRVRRRGSCLRLGPAGPGRPDGAPAAGAHAGPAHRAAGRHQRHRRRAGVRPLHVRHPEPASSSRTSSWRWPSAFPSTWVSPCSSAPAGARPGRCARCAGRSTTASPTSRSG